MRNRSVLLVICLLFLAPRLTSADPVVLFSSFGAGDAYAAGGLPIFGPGFTHGAGEVSPGSWAAGSFVVRPRLSALSAVEVALAAMGRPGLAPHVNVTLWLVPSADGHPGTTILDTLLVTTSRTLAEGGSILRAASTLNPLIAGGLQYWLIASVAAEGQGAVWLTRPIFRPGGLPAAFREVNHGWTLQNSNVALRITADVLDPAPIPEPTTMLLLGSGLAGLYAVRRRRQSGEASPD